MKLRVHRFPSVASTQDEARRLLAAGEGAVGEVVLAERQAAGRGRFGRFWISPVGGLYATFLLEAGPIPSICAGVALLRALERFGVRGELKWPNDLLVEGKKLAGILIEGVGSVLLIGVGVNVTESPLRTSISLADLGLSAPRDAIVAAIAEELQELPTSSETLDLYRVACGTIGRKVRLTLVGDDRSIEGVARDVDDQGRLIVETESGERTVASGTCDHLDP
jgi:BirA family biotin operon repressor/biotin-[acetyl-CoA-carboxylase] ligase